MSDAVLAICAFVVLVVSLGLAILTGALLCNLIARLFTFDDEDEQPLRLHDDDYRLRCSDCDRGSDEWASCKCVAVSYGQDDPSAPCPRGSPSNAPGVWHCSRRNGHDGPCALHPIDDVAQRIYGAGHQ